MFSLNSSNNNISFAKSDFDKFCLCPRCFQIPKISIIHSNKIHIECPFCLNDIIILIEDYLTEIPLLNIQKTCEKNVTHSNKKAYYFCIECRQWLCFDCYHNHLSSNNNLHRFVKYQSFIKNHCNIHLNNSLNLFCFECNIHFCSSCIEQHKEHQIYELSSILSTEKLIEIDDKYQKVKTEYEEKTKTLKNKYITKLKGMINRINKAFEYNKKINDNLSSFLSILFDNYNNCQNNHYILTNLISNLNFVDTIQINFEEEISDKNVDKLVSFFNTYTFIEKKYMNYLINLNLKKAIIQKKSYVNCLLLLHDGRLASCYSDCSIKIHNKTDYSVAVSIYEAHSKGINNISQLKNNQILSCSDDKTIKIWEILEKEYKFITAINYHSSEVVKALPLRNDKVASFVFNAKNIKIWSSNPPYTLITKNLKHKGTVESILEIKKKNMLVTACSDRILRFFNLDNYQCNHTINNVQSSSRNGMIEIENDCIIISGFDVLIVVNTIDYSIVKKVEDRIFGIINAMLLLPDRSLLIGCGQMEEKIFIQIELEEFGFVSEKIEAHQSNINSLVCISDHSFASCSDDKSIKIWEY